MGKSSPASPSCRSRVRRFRAPAHPKLTMLHQLDSATSDGVTHMQEVLKKASAADFKAMDGDKHGAVILAEFCSWIKQGQCDSSHGSLQIY